MKKKTMPMPTKKSGKMMKKGNLTPAMASMIRKKADRLMSAGI